MLQTQIDVYQLEPNSTYIFQVWANNKLGAGEITQVEAVTRHDIQEIGKHELLCFRHLLVLVGFDSVKVIYKKCSRFLNEARIFNKYILNTLRNLAEVKYNVIFTIFEAKYKRKLIH